MNTNPILLTQHYVRLLVSNSHGLGSSVGIATRYGLKGVGIECRCIEISARLDRPWGSANLLYNGYRVIPGGKERPGRESDHSLSSSALVKKEKSYTTTPPMDRTACTEPQCLYSTAIPLLPLLAVRPVQSLSACTRPHFTFFLLQCKPTNGHNTP